MTTTKASEINTKTKVQPTTPNESQPLPKETHHKVLVTDCTFKIQTDWTGAFLGNKVFGHGMHVQNNGNIHINCGPKWLGNGKLCMVSRGGVIHKSGPMYVERKGNSKDVGQKSKKAPTSASSAKKLLAYSELNYGNHVNETHGTLYIRATHIVLDAVDSLTLKSGDATIMQAGQILTNTASYESEIGKMKEKIGSTYERQSQEDKIVQFDPRATSHIVSFGHVNRRVYGDYKFKSNGVGYMGFLGGPPLGYPHVKQRLNGFNLSVKAGNIGIETKLGAIKIESLLSFTQEAKTGAVKLKATAGLFEAKALGVAPLEGTGGFNVKGEGSGDINAGGALNIKSTGPMLVKSSATTTIQGTMIFLN